MAPPSSTRLYDLDASPPKDSRYGTLALSPTVGRGQARTNSVETTRQAATDQKDRGGFR